MKPYDLEATLKKLTPYRLFRFLGFTLALAALGGYDELGAIKKGKYGSRCA
jgi:hypothetical protein